MGLPGHRRTSSHKRRRAAHFALKKINLTACKKCNKPLTPHTACAFCGTYKGRVVTKPAGTVSLKQAKKSVKKEHGKSKEKEAVKNA